MSIKAQISHSRSITIITIFVFVMSNFSCAAPGISNPDVSKVQSTDTPMLAAFTPIPSATPTHLQTPTLTVTPATYLQAPHYLQIYSDTSFLSDILGEISTGGKVEWVGNQEDFSWDPSWYWYRIRFTPDSESSTNSPYVGFGIWLDTSGQYPYLMGVMPGSPAEQAGLLHGDEIIGVDGTNFDEMTAEEANNFLKGPVGTSATLHIRREGNDVPLDITVKREVVENTQLEGYIALPTEAGHTLLSAECPRFLFISQLLMLEPYGIFGDNQGLLFNQDQSGHSMTAYPISTGEVRKFTFNDVEIDAARLVIVYQDPVSGEYKLYPYWQALGFQNPSRYIFQAERIDEPRDNCDGFNCELDYVRNMPDESWTRENVQYFYQYRPVLVLVNYFDPNGGGLDAVKKTFNLDRSLEMVTSGSNSKDLEKIKFQILYEQAYGDVLNNDFINYRTLPEDWVNTVLIPSRIFPTYDLLVSVSNPELDMGQIYRFYECMAYVH